MGQFQDRFCSVGELRAAVLELIVWNREKAHPFRWTFTGYPLPSGIELEKASRRCRMKTSKRSSMSKPIDQQARQLCDAIHSPGGYEHVRVRAERGHVNIYPDEYEPVARFSPLGGGEYSLSFRKHTGRWETMPFAGDISALAQDLVTTLAPHLQRWDFTDRKSGSGH